MQFHNKFSIDISTFHYHKDLFYSEHPNIPEQTLNNVLSGATISLDLGHGLLDFIYADFVSISRFQLILHHTFPRNIQTPPIDFENDSEFYLEEYYLFSATMFDIHEILYSSLYTAICPPFFSAEDHRYEYLVTYINYLIKLQKEYQSLFEFCFDESFYPSVLGELPPAERYYLYNKLHKKPISSKRTEVFDFPHMQMSGHTPPYGMSAKEIMGRMSKYNSLTEEEIAFARKYNAEPELLQKSLGLPRFVNVYYHFSTLNELVELEFTKLLENNVRFKKCKRCNQYFIMKGNYHTNYCDRVAPGETRNCQELAALENYKTKSCDNKALSIYSKYYKRYAARVKTKQIKEHDFKKWKYQALTKRDECTNGIISVDDLISWMEDSFPNRKSHK